MVEVKISEMSNVLNNVAGRRHVDAYSKFIPHKNILF